MQVDNSTLRTYCDCHVKAMLSHVLHRKPPVDGEAAWFGRAFHRFPQHYWQPGDGWKQVLLEFEEKFEAFKEKQASIGKLTDNETIKPEIYLNMAKQFVAQLPRVISDSDEVILLDERTGNPLYRVRHRPEIGFKFPIGPDEYIGRIDTLLEDFNGHLWICDIKTTGEYNRNPGTGGLAIPRFTWKEQFKMSTQLTGYIRALQYHTDQPIAGAIVFAIPRAKGPIKIEHIYVRRTQAELENWETDTAFLIRQFTRDVAALEHDGLEAVIPTGKYSGACTRFGLCPYFQICKNNYAPGLIEAETIFAPWNPLDNEEDKNEAL